jgi:hypothetical protein
MATAIPRAETSPRNENGVLKFYKGNTFQYYIHLFLKDQDNEEINFNNDTDTLTVKFFSAKNDLVKTFEFGKGKNLALKNNIAEFDFTDEITALFDRGRYRYVGDYESPTLGRRTVINAPMLVE